MTLKSCKIVIISPSSQLQSLSSFIDQINMCFNEKPANLFEPESKFALENGESKEMKCC